jgi:cytochrome oxidase Cu insertion factor (SCO1/SenC/PrrC family)
MRFRHALLLVLAILLGVASWHATRASSAINAPTRVGGQDGAQAAPDFTVARYSGGRAVSLADLRGKVVLLYFFFPT